MAPDTTSQNPKPTQERFWDTQQVWGWREWVRISLVAVVLVFLVAVGVATKMIARASKTQPPRPLSVPATEPRTAQPAANNNGVGLAVVRQIHYLTDHRVTTVTVDLTTPVYYQAHRLTNPDRVYFDLESTHVADNLHGKLIQVPVEDSLLRKIRLAERKPGVIRLVLETKRSCTYSAMIASAPYRLLVTLHP